MTEDPYELVLAPPARRALAEHLPEAVASAVIAFLTTALVEQPHRVGKPLRGDLVGLWSARRGTYRVLYRLRDDVREVLVSASSTAEMPTGHTDRPSAADDARGPQPVPVDVALAVAVRDSWSREGRVRLPDLMSRTASIRS